MSQTVRQSSFARGEIAPELQGRSDLDGYNQALGRCRDFIVTPRGSLVNRPGTKYVGTIKTQTDTNTRLVPFLWTNLNGTPEPSILEFGDLYVRVWTSGSYVVEVVSVFAKADLGNLQWAQAGDVLTLCCKKAAGGAYQPQELRRVSAASWVFSGVSVTPQVAFFSTTPTFDSAGAVYDPAHEYKRGDYCTVGVLGPPSYTLKFISLADANKGNGPATSTTQWALAIDSNHPPKKWTWAVLQVWRDLYGALRRTSVNYASGANVDGEPVYSDRPITLSWGAPGGMFAPSVYKVTGYEVFRGLNDVYGYIGSVKEGTLTFHDEGQAPDFSRPPPQLMDPFVYASGVGASAADYPETVCFFEGRRFFGPTAKRPQVILASQPDDIDNFDTSPTANESDALEFNLGGLTRNEVRHIIPMRTLIALGQSGEDDISGRGSPLSNQNVQVRNDSQHGSSRVRPVLIDGRVLYVVERGHAVRDLIYDVNIDAYTGSDISAIASHFFAGTVPVSEIAGAITPYSVAWFALGAGDSPDDGHLLGLTYSPDMKVVAWHRHQLAGSDSPLVESIAAVPDGTGAGEAEDGVYVIVKRIINGITKRYIERFSHRRQTTSASSAVFDTCPVFLDSYIQKNGASGLGVVNMTVTGATYAGGDLVTVTYGGSGYFSAASKGTQVVINAGGASECRITIYDFTSDSVALGTLESGLGAAYQGVPTTDWYEAILTVSGLDHIEGQSVKVYGEDGVVQGPFTVVSGAITLNTPLWYMYVGLPYEPLIELLDVASERSRVKGVKSVAFEVVNSRGLWVGEDVAHLVEWDQRAVADAYGVVPLATVTKEIVIRSSWNRGGRAVLVQKDPLPCTIVGVTREVEFAGKT